MDYVRRIIGLPEEIQRSNKRAKKLGSYSSGPGLTSKAWILPDGKLQTFGSQHYQFLLDNPGIVKSFGVKMPANKEDDPIRHAALRAGFFRVNYEQRGGSLTIEGVKSKLTRNIKDAIIMLFVRSGEQIYSVQIALFADNMGTYETRSAQLFRLDDREKVNHIPFITESRV